MSELKRWTRPQHYMGADWYDYFVGLSQHRDSDCLDRSNFSECLENLGEESDTVIVVRESHFLVGWVEWIAIHESDAVALQAMRDMLKMLDQYPVLNEEHFCELEAEEANETWKNCFNEEERINYIREYRDQFYFADWSDLREVVRGEYFNGYASELIY